MCTIGGRFRSEDAISVPQSIRVGSSYRQRLRMKVQAMFEHFGVPQLFGTYTVNLGAPIYKETFKDGSPLLDIPLFLKAYNKEWSRVWGYIHKTWAKKATGGVKAFVWVVEFQERGVPHVHYCLWTNHSIERMIENNVILAEAMPNGATPAIREELKTLVERHQTHRQPCSEYCRRSTTVSSSEKCRFGFPKPLCATTMFDRNMEQYTYRRQYRRDQYVNTYNPDLLRFCQSNMDIQYNTGSRALFYLSKYISKSGNTHTGAISFGETKSGQ